MTSSSNQSTTEEFGAVEQRSRFHGDPPSMRLAEELGGSEDVPAGNREQGHDLCVDTLDICPGAALLLSVHVRLRGQQADQRWDLVGGLFHACGTAGIYSLQQLSDTR